MQKPETPWLRAALGSVDSQYSRGLPHMDEQPVWLQIKASGALETALGTRAPGTRKV